jgi:hypothetical protein
MKSFVKGVEVEWSQVKRKYFAYIERTNNEDDYDVKFSHFFITLDCWVNM